MGDIDFDKLLKLAESDKAAANAMSFTDMLTEAEKVVKLGEKIVSVFDRAGALPGMVRALGKKWEVDVDTPLNTSQDGTILPATEFHKGVFQELNSIPKEELERQLGAAQKAIQDAGTPTP